jgi:iron complex outermembrane receptor protein
VLLYNPFVNRINNFIYLQPLDFSVEGIPAFAYRSLSEVLFYGNDVGVHYHPHFAHDLHLEATWSLVKTQTPSDSSISMLPPQRLQTTLTYSFEGNSAFRVKEINFMHTWMDAQRTVAFYETPSQAYQLLDIAVALQLGKSKTWECRIGCKNVLNEQYIDHLSRLKNIEMPAPGRNIYVNILYSFKQNKKN